MDSKQHMDNVWENKIRPIFDKARERIDALKPGEKIPATTLAEDLAKVTIQPDGKPMTQAQLYPTLKFLFDGYPGVEVRRGAHGGIFKLPAPSTVGPSADAAKENADGNEKENNEAS